jgi:hypothetical protein
LSIPTSPQLTAARSPQKRPTPSLINKSIPTSAKSTQPSVSPAIEHAMDSTWFYPVGSEVEHKKFGRGTVLPPPAISIDQTTMSVRVKFDNGQEYEFSASGTDLSLKL